VRVVKDASEMDRVQPGDVLVTDMTDPNWEPVMKRASAIVTNRGGRTCHAAIIARELGIPAIVGCGDATDVLATAIGHRVLRRGRHRLRLPRQARFESSPPTWATLPEIPVKIMMNVGNPELAFEFAQLPNGGVGLARLEFIINNMIGIHPKAILEYRPGAGQPARRDHPRSRGYATPKQFYVEKLAEGVATIAAAFWPEAGDRAPVRLQVERVPQAARRRDLRAGRRKPDARLPRRLALHRPQLPRLLRAGMPRDEEGARRDGPDQRRR
jgi:pyruvate,water dikinase